ncbi:MAG: YgiT-type zinc finger protein [Candidatus Margulisbacteria bacterium]|nr:YgiT-type zinc finger protein [Candidatus Margulisiibacteriota bacterium]
MPDDDHGKKKDGDLERYKDLLGEAEEECAACGGHLELEKVNLEDYQEGKLYMMEGVPAYVCQDCDEIWVPEPIMAEFEKMIETAKHKNVASAKESPKEIKKRIKRVKEKK